MIRYAGIAGPIIFFSATIIIALMLPNYSSSTQMISELGATNTNYSLWFNYLGFLPNGLFISAFGIYLYQQFKRVNFNVLPAILITIHGVGMLLATWISCDISCTPQDPSIQQIAHDVIAAIKFPALQLSVLLVGLQLLKQKINMPYAYFSIAIFLISGFFMMMFVLSLETREYTGIYQRLFIASLYVWLIMLALNIKSICNGIRT